MAEPVNGNQLAKITHSIDCLKRETAYVNAIKLEEHQIEGTRYRITLNEAPSIER